MISFSSTVFLGSLESTGFLFVLFLLPDKNSFITVLLLLQLLSPLRLFATPWTASCQAPLSSTISQNLLRFKKCNKAKWFSEEALQIAEKRRELKCKGERERYTHLNAELQRMARRDKKPS